MVREPDGVAVRVGRLEVGRTLPYGSCSHGWRHAEEVRRERGGADDSDKEYSWLHVRTSGFGFTVEPASASRTIASVSSCGRTTGSPPGPRSEEHTSELQSLMRISYAVFCLKKKNTI